MLPAVGFAEEMNLRGLVYSGPLHGILQAGGIEKFAGIVDVVPGKHQIEVVGVLIMPPNLVRLLTGRPSEIGKIVKFPLPGGKIVDLMPNHYMSHDCSFFDL
jgi:hypothetical protein